MGADNMDMEQEEDFFERGKRGLEEKKLMTGIRFEREKHMGILPFF